MEKKAKYERPRNDRKEQPKTGQNGFTLIELAVVMAIIGIIVGLVVKGQALIVNGQVKQLVNQKEEIAGAFQGYYERFAYYPGDDPNAAEKFKGAANGDGNGRVGAGAGATAPNFACREAGTEQCDLWFELRKTNYVSGAGFANPRHSFSGNVALTYNHVGTTAGHWLAFEDIPSAACRDLDMRYDDGSWSTGGIQGSGDYTRAQGGKFTLFFRL